jgi:hypothetical protein
MKNPQALRAMLQGDRRGDLQEKGAFTGVGTERRKTRVWPALAVFLIGFAFLVFGIWRGETAVVLQKAVRICLECIGLG